MSITLDQLQVLGDPLVKGRLPARYLGYKQYTCAVCRKKHTHVLVIRRKPYQVKTATICQRCYWDPARSLSWPYHSYRPLR